MTLPRLWNSRGSTLVEYALVLPMLVWLIFAVIEFGHYGFVQHSIQFATREGVRLALVGRTLTNPNGTSMSREQSIVKKIQDCAAVAVPPGKLSISIYPVNADFTDPNGWLGTQDAGLPGSNMRVRTRYDYAFITPVIGAFFPNGHATISAQATYRNEMFN
jgi:hypothetical protein